MKRKCTLICLFLVLLTGICGESNAFQQVQSADDRPKIGLVLSGGGAKGMAHVGVIRAMEKAGIRPDYVVGTSMGSVVGGLYAMGYNADELEKIIRGIDWDLIISNRVSFENIAFEEKEYYNRYLLEFPIRNGKISLPSGLIEGQMLSEVLHYYTWPARKYQNFDEFPIPFRCIATDISTGKPVIFKDGYLHDALRSSIAIPTAFTAFQLDSTMVVDGGVVNNFPVDVVREMGADFVIGVNVSDEDFIKAEKLEGFGAILMQIAMAESLGKTAENIKITDIYIKPELGPYGTASFGDYDAILKIGDETGEKFYPEFKRVADSLGLSDHAQGIGLEARAIRFKDISVIGNSLFPTPLILSKLGLQAGDEVTRDELQEGINRVFGMNGFYKVDYSLVPSGANDYALQIRVKEKPSKLLNTSIHYDNQFSAGILLNYTARDLIGKSSRTVVIADISENPKFRIDHYKYVGPSKKFAFNLRLNYLNQELPTYENGEEQNLTVVKNSRAEALLISTSSLQQAFSFGMIFENSNSKFRFNSIFSEGIKSAYQRYMGIKFRYYRNSQNDRNFPTKGAEGLIESVFNIQDWIGLNLESGVDTLFLDSDGELIPVPVTTLDKLVETLTPKPHATLYGRYSKFLRLSPKFQFRPEVAGGLVLSTEEGSKIFQDFYVGGYQNIRFGDTRFWGLNYAEVSTPNFIKAGAELQFVPVKKIFLRGGLNFLGFSKQYPLDETEFPDKVFRDETYFGYGADISYNSIMGPISFGVSSNSADKKLRTYFSIGLSFNYSDR
ncbi:alpha/beta hydrolase [Algoriphagus lacus]|uniref:Alpha/beta hydrolase n=1 Tax=Algoriphagus lacus TaxID=2056311 RepID=A0A418PU41_9BACT|nr:patatin-like phospholipase family protein [Algoriphagus lacus]RIW17087.1 alpha/beta hydrolase [Algoriphagus lacus]